MVLAAFPQVGRHADLGTAVEAAALVGLALEVVRALLVAAAGSGIPQLRSRAAAYFVRWGTGQGGFSLKGRVNNDRE